MDLIKNLSLFEIIYFSFLIIFIIFFGLKGILQSLGFSLKIISSIAIPFTTYKKIINFFNNYYENSEYFISLVSNNTLLYEIIIFSVIFLTIYSLFSIFEKALNLNFKKNFSFKLIDFFLGTIYGIFLFSILFYFAFNLVLKNFANEKMSPFIIYNIDIYDKLRSDNNINNDSTLIEIEEKNEIY